MRNRIKQILKEEETDFDWVSNQTPTDRKDIETSLSRLSTIGNYEISVDSLVSLVHNLGLNSEEAKKLSNELHDIMLQVHGDAHSDGYDEGYNNGEYDAGRDWEGQVYDAEANGYDQGKEEGRLEGKEEGIEQGIKYGYDKGFEDGRTYEYDRDTEEFEKKEGSPYSPSDYDDDYNSDY